MYVRLAFAVAAFLEPEILVVDEVLAVGDAEFQKKCLGRMKDVSTNEGRTVLFVSHNLPAVKQLCDRGVLLKNGTMFYKGDIKSTLDKYMTLQKSVVETDLITRKDRQGTGLIKFNAIKFYDEEGEQISNIHSGQNIYIKCFFENNITDDNTHPVRFDINITNENEVIISQLTTFYQKEAYFIDATSNHYSVFIPKLPLLAGKYTLGIYCKIAEDEADWIENAIEFEVEEGDFFDNGRIMPPGFGVTAINHNISLA
jgi:lipopolysaccharide transport system ATP-binding protein